MYLRTNKTPHRAGLLGSYLWDAVQHGSMEGSEAFGYWVNFVVKYMFIFS